MKQCGRYLGDASEYSRRKVASDERVLRKEDPKESIYKFEAKLAAICSNTSYLPCIVLAGIRYFLLIEGEKYNFFTDKI